MRAIHPNCDPFLNLRRMWLLAIHKTVIFGSRGSGASPISVVAEVV
jgi:hypothetical protein